MSQKPSLKPIDQLVSNHSQYLNNWIRKIRRLRRDKQAEKLLQTALEFKVFHPNRPEPNFWIWWAYRDNKMFAKAHYFYQQIDLDALAPRDRVEMYIEIYSELIDKGKHDKALTFAKGKVRKFETESKNENQSQYETVTENEAVRFLSALLQKTERLENRDLYHEIFKLSVSFRTRKIKGHLKQLIDDIEPKKAEFDKPAQQIASIRNIKGVPDDNWLERLNWGREASTILANWVLANESQTMLTDGGLLACSNNSMVLETLKKGKGLIFSGSHLGPSTGVFLWSKINNFPLIFLSGGNGSLSDKSAIYVSRGRVQNVKKTKRHVDNGGIIGITFDHKGNEKTTTCIATHQGIGYKMNSFAARIAYKWKVPNIWLDIYWQDGKIHLSFSELPFPKESETLDDFIKRWLAETQKLYFDYFKKYGPENFTRLGPYPIVDS